MGVARGTILIRLVDEIVRRLPIFRLGLHDFNDDTIGIGDGETNAAGFNSSITCALCFVARS